MRRLGIDIGGTKMLAVVVESRSPDGSGVEIVDERREAAPTSGDIVASIGAFAKSFGPVDSLGVGIAGLVRRIDDVVVTTTHLPNVRGLALRRDLERLLGLPVAVDNDGTCAAVAEWRAGSARGFDDAVVLTIGTGIGGAAIVNGRVARGAHGYAGEFGHMIVVRDGEACPCGRSGCWESYVSGRGLGRLAGGADPEMVLERFANGDSSAKRSVDEFARSAAIGLFDLTSIFDPGCIVLGGGLGSRPEILPVIESHFRGSVGGHAGRELPILVNATLGARAGAIGAAFVGGGD